jgi:hypothetical protein
MRHQNDITEALSIHGVGDSPGSVRALGRSLATYVRQVAAGVGVPAEGTSHEESDTITAYIGLPDRVPAHPDHDLMLVWEVSFGWRVETEPAPGETSCVLGRLQGDPMPTPAAVAAFVADIVAGDHDVACLTGPVDKSA